jgi:hypothetical protein
VTPAAYSNHPRAKVEYTIIGGNSAMKYLHATNKLEVGTNDITLIG